MSKAYIKIPNQGNILQNLRLLYEMRVSEGYSDENGYFSKKAVAEIAVRTLIISSEGRTGNEIISKIDDDSIEETNNQVLQNAKQRMQILRILGLVASDYDSEQYAITDLGNKVLDQVFPEDVSTLPDYRLLMEAFMGITTTAETYEQNSDDSFNCYVGYCICYALAMLNYKISVKEMQIITTYDISEIDDFIFEVQRFRNQGLEFPNMHPHFPKTQNGSPLKGADKLTRTIVQILRVCGIIKLNTEKVHDINYYVCTDFGIQYVEEIKTKLNTKKVVLWTSPAFRKKNLIEQKRICNLGYNNMLYRGGFDVAIRDHAIINVFSPYQMIPETFANELLEKPIRNAPVAREKKLHTLSEQIITEIPSIIPRYRSQEEYDEYIRIYSTKTTIINEILESKKKGKTKDEVTTILLHRHKDSSKEQFYPFVHSLFGAIGLECRGEIGRYDAYIEYNSIIIPAEIKSYTETQGSYNMKGVRQALENKICLYQREEDLEYASLLIGYESPSERSKLEINRFIDAAYRQWSIKILAIDLKSMIDMAVNTVWDQQTVDFEELFKKHGIVEAQKRCR